MSKGMENILKKVTKSDLVKAICLLRYRVLKPTIRSKAHLSLAETAQMVGICHVSVQRLLKAEIEANTRCHNNSK